MKATFHPVDLVNTVRWLLVFESIRRCVNEIKMTDENESLVDKKKSYESGNETSM